MNETINFSGKRMTFTAHAAGCEGALCHPDAALVSLIHKARLEHPYMNFSQAKRYVMSRNSAVADAYHKQFDLQQSEQPHSSAQKTPTVEGAMRADERLAMFVEQEMAVNGISHKAALLLVQSKHPAVYREYLGQFS
jgi:hypothetical protein